MSTSDDTPGELIGTGRSADVYDVGDGKVLRRYRSHHPGLENEIRIMRWVADHGVRVPTVYDLQSEHIEGRDLLMERIEGLTMLEDFERRPWMLMSHIRALVKAQQTVNSVPAPDWMSPASGPIVPSGDSVLHLDLHPMNVMISPDGPVVIDWTNAAGGPPGFDAALTYVEMSTFETEHPRDRAAQKVTNAMFKRWSGVEQIDAFLVAACDHRLADPVITPGERTATAALRKRARKKAQARTRK